MDKLLRIGIVGCGAIGSSLSEAIISNFANEARLVSLYDIDRDKAMSLAKKLKPKITVCSSLDSLIERANLVIEAAEAKSCLTITRRCLNRGRDIMILSVGGIVTHIGQLRKLAKKMQAKVYIPSGAICGIDAIKAASQKKIREVTLITSKNNRSFENSDYIRRRGIRLDKIKKDTLLFSGNARKAIRFFPQNINVAATLSIAGIGQERTQVRIIASPSLRRNVHEIHMKSDAGNISTRVENLVHPDNRKTSFLAVLSAIATLRQILEPVRIGT